MRDIKLTYDNRARLFVAQYPKPRNFKNEVLTSVREGNPLPRINEVFSGGEELLRVFPELSSLSNLFEGSEPIRLDVRVNRETGVINTNGKREDGTDINVTSSVTYADNSGTYQSFGGEELEMVYFSVVKQNVENITTFFTTTMNVSGVDGNGTITDVVFDGGLKPMFAEQISRGGELPATMSELDGDMEYSMGSQPIVFGGVRGDIIGGLNPGFPIPDMGGLNPDMGGLNPDMGGLNPDMGGLNPTPIDFDVPEPYEGEYYIQADKNVLIKLDVVNNPNTEDIEGLELTVDGIGLVDRGIFGITTSIDGDYTNVIQNEEGRFSINNFFIKNNQTQEWLPFDMGVGRTSLFFDDKTDSPNFGKTVFNIELKTQVIPFLQGDKIFITFDVVEEYDGTPALDIITLTTDFFEIDGYEIIDGGEDYTTDVSFGEVGVSNGFEKMIVDEELTSGTWSIPQEEIVEGLYYDIVFDSGKVSFSGRFQREGNRFKSVERKESNLIFSAANVFDQPIMAAGSVENFGVGYISESDILRPVRIIRPSGFLLENVILTGSNNLKIQSRGEFDKLIYVDNFNKEINTDGATAMQLVETPEDCLQCVARVNQKLNFSENTMSDLESGSTFIKDALRVTSQDGAETTFNLRIIGEVGNEQP